MGGIILAAAGVLLVIVAFNKSWRDAWAILLAPAKKQ